MNKVEIHHIGLENFRNYTLAHCDIDNKQPVLFIGANGAGKTNILEALSMLSAGRGLRNAPALEKIRHMAVGFALRFDINYNDEPLVCHIKTEGDNKKPITYYNNNPIKLTDRLLHTIALTPRQNRIFSESSAERRRFFDKLVSAFEPAHLGRLQNLEVLLRERRAYLANNNRDKIWWHTMNQHIAERAVAVAASRLEYSHKCNIALTNHADFLPAIKCTINGYCEGLLQKLSASEAEEQYKDYLIKQTQIDDNIYSPMNADFGGIYLPKNCGGEQCSTGEQKMMVLAIVFAQISLIMAQNGVEPLILMDEITAHLDKYHRDALLSLLVDYKLPTFMSATEEDAFQGFALQKYKVIDNAIQML